ncbi:DUF2935 domain-containing protein [Ruminococcus sp.]|uniref:DUF2935 domain-containing protein n=1 Tax=Ruminococcus sp. TaxID=41978 RepID=UPI0026068AF1|nr:DUF2935 domain-containing protein [Ruminococcus sp.]MDD6988980.1 DUF2935 domain-containing protein [Ruminococcus sp.]MDY6201727.1 DUF2935 domain-containing protein [Ruminococcus sp.]
MNTINYVIKSLELHLFFGRIMKEHSFFLKAGFTPAAASFSNKAEYFMKEFEKLLCQAVTLANGIVRRDVLASGEIVTEFTAEAERKTEHFTGIPINKILTQRELRLISGECPCRVNSERWSQVCRLNRTALKQLDGLIAFKENVLHNVLNCEIFTVNYPLLIEHIIREARLYREYVSVLERDGDITDESMKNTECFWNRIMMEHAKFIRGLLDPTEKELMNTADGFAKEYSALLDNCKNAQSKAMKSESLEETLKFKEFKKAGVQGITGCKIRSLILPLLADHVLREANHYIRLLKC